MTDKHQNECIRCGTDNTPKALNCAQCHCNLAPDHFAFLGVPIDADTKLIRDEFLKQAIPCRPSKTRHLSLELQAQAERTLRRLQLIWEILGDEKKRLEYINSLHTPNTIELSPATPDVFLLRRAVARYIDYILSAALLSTFLHVLYPGLLEWFSQSIAQAEYMKLAVLVATFMMTVIAVWAPIEALLLSTISSTPGKWLMQLHVTDQQDKRLAFTAALARAMEVWSIGMGFGILVLVPITNGFWHERVKQGKSTYWDKQQSCKISERPLSGFRLGASGVIVVQSLALAFLLIAPVPHSHIFIYTYHAKQQNSEVTEVLQSSRVESNRAVPTVIASQPKVTESVASQLTEPQSAALQPATPQAVTSQLAAEAKSFSTKEVVLPPAIKRHHEQVGMQPSNTGKAQPQIWAKNNRQTKLSPGLSDEQRRDCMREYYEQMSMAQELSLGDYARINRKALQIRTQCLRQQI